MKTDRTNSATRRTLRDSDTQIESLRDAYRRGNLTLYLGAGVSLGNGLPTWSQLVLVMYFTAVEGDWKQNWRPYPNYLYAIAEWQLRNRHEPPEITAQKVRHYYSDSSEFLSDLRTALYAGGNFYGGAEMLRQANPVLASVSDICRTSTQNGPGIQAVVTYNYDSLLEIALTGGQCRFVPVWKSSKPLTHPERPIFHVHGYIPPDSSGSEPDGIVFTEEQYHSAANNPYSWSNLCQIQCMSNSVGLMVGLSLTDSNMRRLLNALKITPLRKPCFALLKRPEWPQPANVDLDEIHEMAEQYFRKFQRSGIKADGGRNDQMMRIITAVNGEEQATHTKMLEDLGITPIWYEDHNQAVPAILQAIRGDQAGHGRANCGHTTRKRRTRKGLGAKHAR